MGVEFRALGRLEAERDGVAVDLGAHRQRALLGLLLAHAGTVLSTDRILDELWAGTGGTDKQSSLWVYVSGLRAALEPEREKRSEGSLLLTRAPGYVLAITPDDTDVGRFERAVGQARAVADDDPAAASALLRAGLALWRGHAYEEFTYESWAQGEIDRLEELRLAAVEDRIDADLRLGLDRELVPELHGLVRRHPARDRLVAALALALYRSGRAAEALRVCAQHRAHLVSEFGVEPSRAARDLERRLLDDDPDLLLTAGPDVKARAAGSGPSVRGYELRGELGEGTSGTVYRAYQPLVGREVAIEVIGPERADDPAFVRRFEAQAQLVAGLEHPHVVPLYDYWREPGAAYLVTRLVDAGRLADLLRDGALGPDRAAAVLAQLTSALDAAHRRGVAHGDVRPDTVLVDGDGNAYLSDFAMVTADDRGATGDVAGLARVAAAALTGLSGDDEQVRGALEPAVRRVLDRATTTSGPPYADARAFGRALMEALGAPASPVLDPAVIEHPYNPYKGLRPFGPGDAAEFFGRERLVERLVARLGETGARGRFVALVGASGSGKSSVVRAGLLPALAAGALPTSADWFRTDMTPAPHPFEQLEAALGRVATDPPRALLDLLLVRGGVRRAVSRLLPDDHSQLLLIIDQFEELYTQVDPDTADRFIDELVDLVTAPGTRTHVVLALRADFYDRPLAHRGLGELLRDGTEVITPMAGEELEAAITGPAATVGVDVEPLVVAEIVGDVLDRPGALPLLQYTLTELFEARVGPTIGLAAYRAGGGVLRTLARRADSLLAGLGPAAAETARQVFLRLVSVGDDGVATTRRRALVAEVEEVAGDDPVDRARVRQVLDTFGRHRLLTFDRDPVTRGPTVEISHESLLAHWAMLRAWLDDAGDDLRAHRHLADELRAWSTAAGSPDYLLRGQRLDTTLAWAASTTMALRPAEREYLDASVAARDEERRQRAEEEQRTTAAERTARRRSRQLLLAGALTALVVALATFAWVQRSDARRAEAELAATQDAQRLARLSVSGLATDPQLSLLLAEQAVEATADRGYAVPEALDAVHWALQDLGVQYDVTAATPTAVRQGPGGARGVWALPVDELMDLASASTDRALVDDECREYLGTECPGPTEHAGIEYLDGLESYAATGSADTGEVVVAISADLAAQSEEWRNNLEGLAARYGVRTRLLQLPIHVSPIDAASQGVDADVYYLVSPGELPALAASRPLLDLRDVLDEQTLEADYGSYLVSLSRVGEDGTWPSSQGPLHAVVAGTDLKGMVWTNHREFVDGGYEVPTDWTSFLALADTVVADGRTPFCLELPSGEDSGWPATDWVETVVLRTAGPEFYDAWVDHEVAFDDPAVVAAIRTVGEMVHRPGYLDASPAATARRDVGDGLAAFGGDPPACLMTLFPSLLPGVVEPGTAMDFGNFGFPTFGTDYDDAVVGGAGLMVAVTDRPEVRALMAAVATPDWGEGSMFEDTWPLLLPANARFDALVVSNPPTRPIVTGIGDAIRTDTFRYDASDLMPTEPARAFLAGMMRLFEEGSMENLDALSLAIAQDVEAAWLAHEEAADGD